jgi:hypothetical protein
MIGRAQQRRERHRPAQGQPAVRLHIEQLVLHGVAPAQAAAMRQGFEAELTRLAAEPGQVFAPANARRVGPLHLTSASAPDRTGRAAGAAVWGVALNAGKD